MGLWTYSPEDVTILLGGVHPVEGYVDGTFISISKETPSFTSIRSTDGMTARKYVNDQTYIVKINIISMSPTNDVLSNLWLLDETTHMGKFPLLIKDSSGSGHFFSPTAWIEAIPDMSYANAPEIRTWGLKATQCAIHIGGNDGAGSTASKILQLAASGLPLVQQFLKGG